MIEIYNRVLCIVCTLATNFCLGHHESIGLLLLKLSKLNRFSSQGTYHCCAIIYCDNLSVVFLAANPIMQSRTKHFELDLYFMKNKLINGVI